MKRALAILAVAMLGWGGMSLAADMVDGVAAIVNDKVITYSDVLMLVQPVDWELRRTYSGQELEEQRRKAETDALNSLIERALIVQDFDGKGNKVPDTVIDQEIDHRIATEFAGDRAKFIKTLEAEHLTLSQLREQEREHIIVQFMRNHKAQQAVIVSPFKIEKYYQDNLDRFKVGDQIKLRMIFIKRGEEVPAATNAPEQSPSVSMDHLSRPNSEATVALTNTAGVPVTNATAAVSGDGTNGSVTAEAPPPPVDLQRKLAEEILAKLDAGEGFESLARAYSEGKEAREGGDWGWIGRDILRKELNETAFSLKAGQHSRVIETAEGYYILEVDIVKSPHTTPLAEVRDEIEKTLLEEQRTKMQEDWVKGLRTKAYIRVF
jgi:peptidyl-prolyl cis-trans isomerase SurA